MWPNHPSQYGSNQLSDWIQQAYRLKGGRATVASSSSFCKNLQKWSSCWVETCGTKERHRITGCPEFRIIMMHEILTTTLPLYFSFAFELLKIFKTYYCSLLTSVFIHAHANQKNSKFESEYSSGWRRGHPTVLLQRSNRLKGVTCHKPSCVEYTFEFLQRRWSRFNLSY